MRRTVWLFAAVVALSWCGQSNAQNRRLPFFFGGVDPTQITQVPINTSNSVVPFPVPNQTRPTIFKLLDYLPRIRLPIGKTIIGRSIFPSENEFPGPGYLNNFHIRRAPFAQ